MQTENGNTNKVEVGYAVKTSANVARFRPDFLAMINCAVRYVDLWTGRIDSPLVKNAQHGGQRTLPANVQETDIIEKLHQHLAAPVYLYEQRRWLPLPYPFDRSVQQ